MAARAATAWWARWWVVLAAIILVAGGGSAAGVVLTAGPTASQVRAQKVQHARQIADTRAAEVAHLLSFVNVSPAAGVSGVSPDARVSVTTTSGFFTSVTLVDSTGSSVAGKLSPGLQKWVSTGPLTGGTAYQVKAVVAGEGGIKGEKSSNFTTLTPVALVGATVFPSTGMTVGVGQPIVLRFDHYIDSAANEASVISHLSVAMSKPVPGGWHWFSPTELHFRPATYWPTGETVSVTGDLGGWDAGNGRWGTGQLSSTFAIGDARVSVANLQTEEMTVTLNGAVVATYPISGGRPKYPTMGGTHIVLDRETVVHMVSSTVGIPVNSPDGYDEKVYDDVHISDSGEYVHAAPWSVGSQGVTNVSHGCINLSPSHALTFFDFSRVGDIVEVLGSPRPPSYGDHGVMDWTTPWSDWTQVGVHKLPAATPSTGAPTTVARTTSPTTAGASGYSSPAAEPAYTPAAGG